MNSVYYLAHGGPGSGRYPLGSGDRPYQKFEGSRRKKSSGISGYISAKRKETKLAKEIQRRQAAEKHNADKERVLRSGTAKEVSRYKGELSKAELQEVYNRLNLEKKISEMSSTEILDNQKALNTILNNVTKTAGWVAEGAAAYNILASVYNGMVEDSKKLPVLKINR